MTSNTVSCIFVSKPILVSTDMLTPPKFYARLYTMTPVKPELFEYEFQPEVITKTRNRLGLSQAKLAELLDLPVNTLSRWESGTTVPDANSLAAIYSIAKQKNIPPQFFIHRITTTQTKQQRTKLRFAWDYQNLGLEAKYIEFEWKYMIRYLKLFHPSSCASQILRAYISPNQHVAGEVLGKLKFDIYERFFDADSQLARDSIEDCRKNPKKWTYILVANDGDYAQMLKELQASGVDTYLWASDECSERLRNSVKNDHFIHWDAPYVVMTCMDVVTSLKGERITRSQFGQQCKEALDEEECYPDEVGFSRRNPYGSLLRWLDRQGVITVNEVTGKPDMISIVVQGKP